MPLPAYARFVAPDERGRRENAKPDWAGRGGGGGSEETDATTCYSYIAKGAKWNTAESFLFNPDNSGSIGLIELAGINGAFQTWEQEADDATIFVPPEDTTTLALVADTSAPDGKNEIYFASIPDKGVLGYTIVWYTRSRGRNVGRIVEADMVIDDDFEWSWYIGEVANGISAEDTNEFDFWSVFTHEAGHWVGMGHTKTSDLCSTQTMYPSISAGDSSKRLLVT